MSRRIDIRIPEDTLERIDREAAERKMTRTAVLIERWNESRSEGGTPVRRAAAGPSRTGSGSPVGVRATSSEDSGAVELEAAPFAPARSAEDLPSSAPQEGHGAQGEPEDRELRTRMKHPSRASCSHGKARILRLKTCPDCGVRV